MALKVLNRKLLDDPDFLLRFQASPWRLCSGEFTSPFRSGEFTSPFRSGEFTSPFRSGEFIRQPTDHMAAYGRLYVNEAASTGRIHHANVVTIHESGQADDGTPYIAMEYGARMTLPPTRGVIPVCKRLVNPWQGSPGRGRKVVNGTTKTSRDATRGRLCRSELDSCGRRAHGLRAEIKLKSEIPAWYRDLVGLLS